MGRVVAVLWRALLERQSKSPADIDQGFGARIDQTVVVIGARRDAQPLAGFHFFCAHLISINVTLPAATGIANLLVSPLMPVI